MKGPLLIISTLLLVPLLSQIQPKCETGRTAAPRKEISDTTEVPEQVWTNPREYRRDPAQSLRLKLRSAPVAIWIDPEKWKPEQWENNEPIPGDSLAFVLPDTDVAKFNPKSEGAGVVAMLAVQDYGFEVKDSLVLAMAYGGRSSTTEPDLVKAEIRKEYRTVNGTRVLRIQAHARTAARRLFWTPTTAASVNG